MGTLAIYLLMFLAVAALVGGGVALARRNRHPQSRGESHPPR